MAAFTVRPATLADAEALCALHKASVRALCLGAYTAAEIEAWLREREPQGFRHAMTDGGETMLVAEHDGAVVGFASIKGTVLFGLYVDPAKGRGAGRMLLAAAEDEVRRRGASVLSLQATLNAVPFYRQHGFMRQERSTVRRGGRDLAVLDMTKTLTPSSRPEREARSGGT
jgi:putative acetyltransferase